MSKRQTQQDRMIIKNELACEFKEWNGMTDEQLLSVVHRRAPAVFPPEAQDSRGDWLRFLTLDRLDRIN